MLAYLAVLEVLKADDLDAELRGAVAGYVSAELRGHYRRLCRFAAEAVAQDRKLVESLGADVAGLAAYEHGDDALHCHDVDLVRDVVTLKISLPVHDGTGDDGRGTRRNRGRPYRRTAPERCPYRAYPPLPADCEDE